MRNAPAPTPDDFRLDPVTGGLQQRKNTKHASQLTAQESADLGDAMDNFDATVWGRDWVLTQLGRPLDTTPEDWTEPCPRADLGGCKC